MLYSKQSAFSRTKYNEGKSGAYYTDLAHCRDIAKAFSWSDGEVTVLEPSIGDASAVKAVTDVEHNSNIKIFGVELAPEAAAAVKKDPLIEDCLCADFTDGVMISNNAFSFIFQNPPYLDDYLDDEHDRLELQFLRKSGEYLQKGGIQVCVISHRQLLDQKYLRCFLGWYEVLFVYRFRPDEYAKFHQVVICGKKIPYKQVSKDEMELAVSKWKNAEDIPILPDHFDHKIAVPASSSDGVKLFAKRIFDADEAAKRLTESFPEDIFNVFDEKVSIEAYAAVDIGRPPIPLKKDSLYLLAIAGAGQGLAGDESNGDLHLQRGVADVVENTEVVPNQDVNMVKCTSSTAISLTIIENDGKISELV